MGDDAGARPPLRRVGRSAVLLEVDDSPAVFAWHAELRRRRDAGELAAVEIVPGARTVLVDGVPDAAALIRALRTWPAPAPLVLNDEAMVTVPTRYDGPDLADIARRWGVTAGEAVDLHSAIEFRVAFCGFAPGFAYRTGLPAHRQVPRLDAPRVQVPAGSVAVAGPYCAVYPNGSPGGWRLIGRTELVLFDLAGEPAARLSPGTRVRLPRWMGERGVARGALRGANRDDSVSVEVLRAGALTTVQDLGRAGYAHLGVPRAGAVDLPALLLANRLVGNPPTAAGLEITMTGCTLRFDAATVVAVTGAEVTRLRVGTRPADAGVPVPVRAGAVVEIGPARSGLRSYLAIAGGIAVEPVLGSRATDTLSGLGPPVLRNGDVLPLGPPGGAPAPVWFSPRPAVAAGPVRLRVGLGPHQDWFTRSALTTLTTATYAVSPLSDRIGARLTGPPLARTSTGELPSEGIVLGAVQVPPAGHPLVFLANHPTTGGYPVIAVVDEADLPLLAQARPGTTVTFSRQE